MNNQSNKDDRKDFNNAMYEGEQMQMMLGDKEPPAVAMLAIDLSIAAHMMALSIIRGVTNSQYRQNK